MIICSALMLASSHLRPSLSFPRTPRRATWLSMAMLAGGILAIPNMAMAIGTGKTLERGPEPAPKSQKVDDIEIRQYCQNIADQAKDQRYAWQLQNLVALQGDIDKRIEHLESLRVDVRDWIEKRDRILQEVKGHVISVYEHMRPDAAAERMANLDNDVAIALLTRMRARAVSSILDEMEPSRASELTSGMTSLGKIETGKKEQ